MSLCNIIEHSHHYIHTGPGVKFRRLVQRLQMTVHEEMVRWRTQRVAARERSYTLGLNASHSSRGHEGDSDNS